MTRQWMLGLHCCQSTHSFRCSDQRYSAHVSVSVEPAVAVDVRSSRMLVRLDAGEDGVALVG